MISPEKHNVSIMKGRRYHTSLNRIVCLFVVRGGYCKELDKEFDSAVRDEAQVGQAETQGSAVTSEKGKIQLLSRGEAARRNPH